MNQGDQNITQYFTKLKKLWQEIEYFQPLPSGTCDPCCTYQILPTIKSYIDGDYVISFLKDLNEQYSPVRAQIMLMNPLPPINKVFSCLIQQERQILVPTKEEKLITSFNIPYMRGRPTENKPKDYAFGRSRGIKIAHIAISPTTALKYASRSIGYLPIWRSQHCSYLLWRPSSRCFCFYS